MEELSLLLEKLAQELGTTIEYLWSVLIYQAYVSAISDIFIYIMYVIFVYISLRYIFPYLKMKYKEEKDKSYHSDEEYPAIGMILLTICLFCGGIAIVFFGMPETITKIFNPEYWALQQVLYLIK